MQAEARAAGETDRKLGYLDALRGLAILAVLLVHVGGLTRQTANWWQFAYTGQRGVQLFYMVSAFTLSLSLDTVRNERHSLRNYFVRRLFRIAPLFYLVIGINLLLNRFVPADVPLHGLRPSQVLSGFFFLNGFSPKAINGVVAGGWSIAVETTFYLLLPLLFRYINTAFRALLLFLVSAPLLLKLSASLADRAHDFDHRAFYRLFWFPAEFSIFALGMLAFFIWKEHLKDQVIATEKRRSISLILLASSFVLYWAGFPISDYRIVPSSYMFLPLILALCLYPWPLLVNRFTRLLGKLSYSLYLVHPFVLVLVMHLLDVFDREPAHPISSHLYSHPLALPLMLVLILGMSVPICMLSWRFVEQPGVRLGRRMIAGWEKRAVQLDTSLVPSVRDLKAVGNTRDAQF